MIQLEVTRGQVSFNLRLPKPQGFEYRIVKQEAVALSAEAIVLAEPNAARNTLGTTATASAEGDFTSADNGDIIRNNQPNTTSLAWIVLDFHKEKTINQIALTAAQALSEEIDFDLKLWGGTIFFPSSPPVRGTIAKGGEESRTVRKRFAEQRTEKALIEFGTLDGEGNFVNDKSLVLAKLEIAAFSFPTDLTFGIGEQPPFFTYPGELAPGAAVALPDFSSELNRFLDNSAPAERGDELLIPFKVQSRTDGIISFKRLEASQATDISANLTDWGYRLQGIINGFLAHAFSQEAKAQGVLDFNAAKSKSVFISLPRSARVTEAHFHIRGALSEDRLLLDNAGQGDRLGVLGSDHFLLAQRFRIDTPADLTSLGIMLEFLSAEVEVSVAIHSEYQAKPAQSALPGSEIKRQFPMPGEAEALNTPTLVTFQMDSPLALHPGDYWIVLSAARGQLTWRVNDTQPNPGAFVYTRLDGATHWVQRRHPTTSEPISGIFKIAHLAPDYSDLIKIVIGSVEAFVPAIQDPAQIDQEVTALRVNDKAKSLVELLNGASGQIPPAITFSTLAKGVLELSDLHISFNL